MEMQQRTTLPLKEKLASLFMPIFSVLLFLVLVGFSGYQMTKVPVTLQVDGDVQHVKTHAETVGSLLESQGITVESHDVVKPARDANVSEGLTVTWKPAKSLTLVVDGNEQTVWTTEEHVEDVLRENGYTIKPHDHLTPSKQTAVKEDMTIHFNDAFQVSMKVGNDETDVWTTEQTVDQLLQQESIELGDLDQVEPEKSATVTPDTTVTVTRVEKVTDIVREEVDYDTVTRKDNDLTTGQQDVVRSGEEGVVEKHYTVTLENGEEVSRELEETETVKEPEDRLVVVGTKPTQQTVSRQGDQSVAKEFYVSSTAYTAYCNGCSGITANGQYNLKQNPDAKVIAVDPDVIPLGSKVIVEGYGPAIAADTGSAIQGNSIDVFFPTKSQAYAWGRKNVLVKVLED